MIGKQTSCVYIIFIHTRQKAVHWDLHKPDADLFDTTNVDCNTLLQIHWVSSNFWFWKREDCLVVGMLKCMHGFLAWLSDGPGYWRSYSFLREWIAESGYWILQLYTFYKRKNLICDFFLPAYLQSNISDWICINIPAKSSDLVGWAHFPRPSPWSAHCNLRSTAGPLLL